MKHKLKIIIVLELGIIIFLLALWGYSENQNNKLKEQISQIEKKENSESIEDSLCVNPKGKAKPFYPSKEDKRLFREALKIRNANSSKW